MFVRLLYSELKSGKNAKELFPSKAIFLNGPLQVKVVECKKKFKKVLILDVTIINIHISIT